MIKDAWEFLGNLKTGHLTKGTKTMNFIQASNNLPMMAVAEALQMIQLTEQRRIVCAHLPGFFAGPPKTRFR